MLIVAVPTTLKILIHRINTQGRQRENLENKEKNAVLANTRDTQSNCSNAHFISTILIRQKVKTRPILPKDNCHIPPCLQGTGCRIFRTQQRTREASTLSKFAVYSKYKMLLRDCTGSNTRLVLVREHLSEMDRLSYLGSYILLSVYAHTEDSVTICVVGVTSDYRQVVWCTQKQ